MTLEIAIIDVIEGSETEFEDAFAQIKSTVTSAPGVHSVTLSRGVEQPSRFVLQVEWSDVQAHEDFRQTDRFAAWRTAVGPFFASPPQAAHYEPVATG